MSLQVPDPKPDVFILGLPFWNPTFEQFHDWWIRLMASPERNNKLLMLGNPNTLNIAWEQPDYFEVLRDFDVFVNDGVGIRIASRMRGKEVPYNFAGTDLMPRLFDESPTEITAFFFGATEEVNQTACDRITERYPNVKIIGRQHGYCDPEKDALPLIQAAGADVLMVALGQPKQEFFMRNCRDQLNCKVAVTCGGMFDFFSGAKPRAPRVMRSLGMEWVYRLWIEPKRMWRRYIYGNPAFLLRAMRTIVRDGVLLEHANCGARSLGVRASTVVRS